jgi:hypothetical protein
VKVNNKTQNAGTSGQEAEISRLRLMASARQGGQRAEFRIADCGLRISKKAENRDSPVGAAFSRDSNAFYDFYGFYDFYAFYDFSDSTL